MLVHYVSGNPESGFCFCCVLASTTSWPQGGLINQSDIFIRQLPCCSLVSIIGHRWFAFFSGMLMTSGWSSFCLSVQILKETTYISTSQPFKVQTWLWIFEVLPLKCSMTFGLHNSFSQVNRWQGKVRHVGKLKKWFIQRTKFTMNLGFRLWTLHFQAFSSLKAKSDQTEPTHLQVQGHMCEQFQSRCKLQVIANPLREENLCFFFWVW